MSDSSLSTFLPEGKDTIITTNDAPATTLAVDDARLLEANAPSDDSRFENTTNASDDISSSDFESPLPVPHLSSPGPSFPSLPNTGEQEALISDAYATPVTKSRRPSVPLNLNLDDAIFDGSGVHSPTRPPVGFSPRSPDLLNERPPLRSPFSSEPSLYDLAGAIPLRSSVAAAIETPPLENFLAPLGSADDDQPYSSFSLLPAVGVDDVLDRAMRAHNRSPSGSSDSLRERADDFDPLPPSPLPPKANLPEADLLNLADATPNALPQPPQSSPSIRSNLLLEPVSLRSVLDDQPSKAPLTSDERHEPSLVADVDTSPAAPPSLTQNVALGAPAPGPSAQPTVPFAESPSETVESQSVSDTMGGSAGLKTVYDHTDSMLENTDDDRTKATQQPLPSRGISTIGSAQGQGDDDWDFPDLPEPTTDREERPPAEEPPSLTLSLFSRTVPPRQRIFALLGSLGINVVLPFINGVMLGMLCQHHADYCTGLSGPAQDSARFSHVNTWPSFSAWAPQRAPPIVNRRTRLAVWACEERRHVNMCTPRMRVPKQRWRPWWKADLVV